MKWECEICGYVYDEEVGNRDEKIAPGTPWERLPEEWVCPDCGASKQEFQRVLL